MSNRMRVKRPAGQLWRLVYAETPEGRNYAGFTLARGATPLDASFAAYDMGASCPDPFICCFAFPTDDGFAEYAEAVGFKHNVFYEHTAHVADEVCVNPEHHDTG